MARAAIQRGLRPILAGRKTAALKKIADELSLTKQEIQARFFIVNAGKIPCKWLTPATLRFMTACVTLPQVSRYSYPSWAHTTAARGKPEASSFDLGAKGPEKAIEEVSMKRDVAYST